MTSVNLSKHDVNVLEKIKDPESNPTAGIIIDDSLPRDPHVADAKVYEEVKERERGIIQSIQKHEMQFNQSQSLDSDEIAVAGYRECMAALDALIVDHPDYASARNNRVQVWRRLYGDAMLLSVTATTPMPLINQPDASDKRSAAAAALEDLDQSINLLSPASFSTPMSPQAARTLSMAHTQRAAIYLSTGKLLSHRSLDVDEKRPEAQWGRIEFEEAASRDLALGGRYGNEIAKGLAVSVNPTAKLCGQIVREAMKKEYGPTFEA